MKVPLDSKGQSYFLHTIELQHYKRRMKYMLSAAQSHQAEVQVSKLFVILILTKIRFLQSRSFGEK